ncbi:hypothetical protein OA081_02300 [Gammaproteobacteria bacterium]|nr:hypothetical protein [Gammaproteobacteria bacterium]
MYARHLVLRKFFFTILASYHSWTWPYWFGIFILGGITFLTAFVLFKISAFMYLLQDIKEGKERSWLKLFQVFVVDLVILIAGVIGTGILFMTLLKMAHG